MMMMMANAIQVAIRIAIGATSEEPGLKTWSIITALSLSMLLFHPPAWFRLLFSLVTVGLSASRPRLCHRSIFARILLMEYFSHSDRSWFKSAGALAQGPSNGPGRTLNLINDNRSSVTLNLFKWNGVPVFLGREIWISLMPACHEDITRACLRDGGFRVSFQTFQGGGCAGYLKKITR